jgi:hypothetical protein
VSQVSLGRKICNGKGTRIIISTVFIASFLSALPTPFEWKVDTRVIESTNETVVTLDFSEFGKNEAFKAFYSWYLAVTFTLIPLITIAVFNSLLIVSVRNSPPSLNSNNPRAVTLYGARRNTQEKRVTVMLISVIVFFLVCQTPTAVTLVYSHFDEPEPFTWSWCRLRIMGNIFNLLVTVNSASNFVIYCVFSTKYRETFQHVFGSCLKKLQVVGRGQQAARNSRPAYECPAMSIIGPGHSSGPYLGHRYQHDDHVGRYAHRYSMNDCFPDFQHRMYYSPHCKEQWTPRPHLLMTDF